MRLADHYQCFKLILCGCSRTTRMRCSYWSRRQPVIFSQKDRKTFEENSVFGWRIYSRRISLSDSVGVSRPTEDYSQRYCFLIPRKWYQYRKDRVDTRLGVHRMPQLGTIWREAFKVRTHFRHCPASSELRDGDGLENGGIIKWLVLLV